ncbi:hypothetical protein [Providencia hangzhouensis]
MKKIMTYSLLTLLFSSNYAFSNSNEENKTTPMLKLYSNTIAICARAHQERNSEYIKDNVNRKFLEKYLDKPIDEDVLKQINEISNEMSHVELLSDEERAKDSKDSYKICIKASIDDYNEMVKEKNRKD